MLNTDLKLFWKALAAELKSVLPSLTASQQTVYVPNRYIDEAGRLPSDILDVSDKLSIDDYLVTVDFQKAFSFLDQGFLLVVLKKIVFGDNSIDWIKILLTNHDCCAIIANGGSNTPYLKLDKYKRC